MKERNSVTAATSQISAGAIAVTLLFLMTLGERTFQLWYPLAWLCFGPLLYGADCLFLRRERSVQALALLNGCAGLSLLIVFLLLDGWRGIWVLIATGTACLVLSAQAATLCMEPVRLSSVLQWLDIGLVLLAVLAAYLGALGMSMVWAMPSAIGCGAAILGMLNFRAGGRLSSRGWGLLTALLAVLSGAVWLGANTISRGAGKGLFFLWNSLKAAVLAACEGLYQFMKWLTSVLPTQEYGEIELDQGTGALDLSASEYMEVVVPRFVYVLLGLLILFVLVLLLRYAGRFLISGEKVKMQVRQKPVHKRISLLMALKRKLAWLVESFRLRLYLYRERDTELGVFYGLLRRAYGRSWREGAGESPREFLTSLAAKAGEDEELHVALTDLIPMVEQALYAPGGKKASYPQAALLRSRRKTLFSRRQNHHNSFYR
ncbi:MAG: hypothetical protein LUC60_02275 [Lachnospiraceae bacterium]|nr:hypothetical protein [Lachnospiraceae bacterium]